MVRIAWCGLRGAGGCPLRVTDVGPQGEQAEEGAEDVLAFGGPGDGFDVERMQGKEGSDEGTAPGGVGGASQKQKEQQGVGDMETEVDEVMAGRVKPEEFNIQRMREPSQRVPVGGVIGAKGPGDSGPGQTLLKVRIGGDVSAVIVVDELVETNRPISGQRDCREEQAKERHPAIRSRPKFRSRVIQAGRRVREQRQICEPKCAGHGARPAGTIQLRPMRSAQCRPAAT